MRIVCKTKRAYDHVLIALQSFGSGEYRSVKSRKTFELAVSMDHFVWLIDIIRLVFIDLLGKKAWREEIDFFQLKDNGDAECVAKGDDTSEKRILHLVFGENPAYFACESELDRVIDGLRNYDGSYVVREYDTVAEERAYRDALADLDGWYGYAVLEDCLYDSDIEQFDKMYDEMRKETES